MAVFAMELSYPDGEIIEHRCKVYHCDTVAEMNAITGTHGDLAWNDESSEYFIWRTNHWVKLVDTENLTELAQDSVGAMADSESLNYDDATPKLSVKVACSVVRTAAGLQFVNDLNLPGNNKVYSTDGTGTKSWHDFPAETDPVFGASEAASFVAGDKTKLDGIAAGAEVNVNADWASGAGDSQILNKPSLGTVSPINLDSNPANFLKGDGTWGPAGAGGPHAATHITGGGDTIADAVAGGASGLMSGTDKTKLNGIASGAEVNVNADWNAGSGDAQILNKPTIPTQYTDELAQDAVGSMISTNNLNYVDATPLLEVKKQMSITDDVSGLKLVGDASSPGNNKVYGTDGSGNKGWQTPSSGSDPWTYLQVNGGSDFTTTSGTPVDATGLAFTPAANTTYEFEAMLIVQTATNSNNPKAGLAWPTGLTFGIASIVQQAAAMNTAAVVAQGNHNAALLIAAGGVPNSNQPYPCRVWGSLRTGATPSGALKIQLAAETAGTTVRFVARSFLKYRTLPF